MPPKVLKAKRPKIPMEFSSDDAPNPSQSSQESLILATSGEDSTSLESRGHQPECSKEIHPGSRRQSILNTKTILENMEQEIDQYVKNNNEKRLAVYQKYAEQFLNLGVMWNVDLEQEKKQREKVVSVLKKQQDLFKESLITQKQRTKEFKDLCEIYIKSTENCEKRHENAIAAEVKIQMVILEKIITEMDQEESTEARQSFLSLLI